MSYQICVKATKYFIMDINNAPDEESAKQFALAQVKQNFRLAEIVEIEDADFTETEKTDDTINTDVQSLPQDINTGGDSEKCEGTSSE